MVDCPVDRDHIRLIFYLLPDLFFFLFHGLGSSGVLIPGMVRSPDLQFHCFENGLIVLFNKPGKSHFSLLSKLLFEKKTIIVCPGKSRSIRVQEYQVCKDSLMPGDHFLRMQKTCGVGSKGS